MADLLHQSPHVTITVFVCLMVSAIGFLLRKDARYLPLFWRIDGSWFIYLPKVLVAVIWPLLAAIVLTTQTSGSNSEIELILAGGFIVGNVLYFAIAPAK